MDYGRFLGTALIVGLIGPLFWLGVNVLENKLKAKGYRIAGFDLFSFKAWKSLLSRSSGNRRGEQS